MIFDHYRIKKIISKSKYWNVTDITLDHDGVKYTPRVEVIRSLYNPKITSQCITTRQRLREIVEIVELNLYVNNTLVITRVNIFHHGKSVTTDYSYNNMFSLSELEWITRQLIDLQSNGCITQ